LALQAVTLGILAWTGVVQVWHVIVLAFLLGTMNAFDTPTRQSFIIELVGKNQLLNAIGLNSISFNLARILGPAIAGILIAWTGVAGCFLINGVQLLRNDPCPAVDANPVSIACTVPDKSFRQRPPGHSLCLART
jgi:MFS family permease